MKIVEVIDLYKEYKVKVREGFFKSKIKNVKALNGVSFHINKGEIFSLVGPNGAGKTTTIRIVATLLLPDKGEAFVNGYSILKEPSKVRENLGIVLYPNKGFYSRLTGIENLVYYGRLYGLSKKEALKRAKELVELVNLGNDAYRTVDEYSLGMMAKLSIAKCLINDAPILLFDEPTIGLDPLSARKIRSLIKELALKGKTILLTSHNMWEVENLSDRVAMINKGKIILIGSPTEVKQKLKLKYMIEVEILAEDAKFDNTSIGERGYPVVKLTSEKPTEDLLKVVDEIREKGYQVGYIKIIEPSLEEAFAKIVENEL
ncbi:MAG: ABC transporter ATP-binding protein [Thermoproteota archaeon]|jgi:ABC-2 type transport system ATP-binding protein|nr:ABC transporter ATP-binding protein [Thermoproteota archaeon]